MFVPIIEICSFMLGTCEMAINRKNSREEKLECLQFVEETIDDDSMMLAITLQNFPNISNKDSVKFLGFCIEKDKVENFMFEKGYESELVET